MSFGRIENYFESMRRVMEVRFVLPDDPRFRGGNGMPENPNYARPPKLLMLLNGYTHNNLEWLVHTGVFDLALMYNLALLFPSGENGFYTNWEGCNDQFADFVGNELIDFAVRTFGLPAGREDHFVMGLSMGGFGALHTGLAYPQNFSKIAALSSALVVHEVAGGKPGFVNAGGDYAYYRRIFGDLDKVLTSPANPEQLVLDILSEGKTVPELYLACGTEDFLLEPNRQFKAFLDAHGVPAKYTEGHGVHDYAYWNQHVEPAIQWMLGLSGEKMTSRMQRFEGIE